MKAAIAILDMQPIDPPVGGGRLRLLGLYHGLGEGLQALYVGTYDWRGPGFRRQFLSENLEELLVPLSDAHFAAAEARSQAVGHGVIDTTFHELAHLSPDYVAAAREAAASADIVVFSHPWVFSLVSDVLDPARQMVVYDSHNVEGLLRMDLLDDSAAGTEVVRGVVAVEYALCHAADLVLACSHEDRATFADLYGIPFDRMRVVPNGTFTKSLTPATRLEKTAACENLGLGAEPIAFFLASNYAPNVEAARFIASVLAPSLPRIRFVVAGGVGDSLGEFKSVPNLMVTGLISEEKKCQWLKAADIAINPMFGGSGTNIKMFDFMAAGLPIVTTPIGARGIETGVEALAVVGGDEFRQAIESILADPARGAALGQAAREQAEMLYSWEHISRHVGTLFTHRRKMHGRTQPFFSVVVPTYERHASLSRLVERLSQQSWRDFEVLIVDQSAEPWSDRDREFNLDLAYVHTDIRGAVYARNTGSDLAMGKVIAFIDDDCEPCPNWLQAARAEFVSGDVVGVEGLIVSDRVDPEHWRIVTNEGFEGIAFQTANLFLRAEIFHAVNGFDLEFDHPHFREDTDLGWRAQKLGSIPFSRAAWVYHPPQPRAVERESAMTRSRFFEKDALLLRKHPQKYMELMFRESQWASNPYFWTYFKQGLHKYKVDAPSEIRAIMPKG